MCNINPSFQGTYFTSDLHAWTHWNGLEDEHISDFNSKFKYSKKQQHQHLCFSREDHIGMSSVCKSWNNWILHSTQRFLLFIGAFVWLEAFGGNCGSNHLCRFHVGQVLARAKSGGDPFPLHAAHSGSFPNDPILLLPRGEMPRVHPRPWDLSQAFGKRQQLLE